MDVSSSPYPSKSSPSKSTRPPVQQRGDLSSPIDKPAPSRANKVASPSLPPASPVHDPQTPRRTRSPTPFATQPRSPSILSGEKRKGPSSPPKKVKSKKRRTVPTQEQNRTPSPTTELGKRVKRLVRPPPAKGDLPFAAKHGSAKPIGPEYVILPTFVCRFSYPVL